MTKCICPKCGAADSEQGFTSIYCSAMCDKTLEQKVEWFREKVHDEVFKTLMRPGPLGSLVGDEEDNYYQDALKHGPSFLPSETLADKAHSDRWLLFQRKVDTNECTNEDIIEFTAAFAMRIGIIYAGMEFYIPGHHVRVQSTSENLAEMIVTPFVDLKITGFIEI